jgi:hypothetical protein
MASTLGGPRLRHDDPYMQSWKPVRILLPMAIHDGPIRDLGGSLDAASYSVELVWVEHGVFRRFCTTCILRPCV